MQHRPIATAACVGVLALTTSACGLLASPSVSTTDEVIAALTALQDQGHEARLTARIAVDEGELRTALREDEGLLELVGQDLEEQPEDAEDLIGQLAEAQAEVERHAVILARGDDRSGRFAIETDGQVWVDVRGVSTFDPEAEDLLAPFDLELQAMADLGFIADLFGGDGFETADVDEARDDFEVVEREGLEFLPELAPLFELAEDFLDGDLVALGGEFDPHNWISLAEQYADDLGFDPDEFDAMVEEFRDEYGELLATDRIDPAEAAEALFAFDDFRVEEGVTKVDVSVKVQEGGAYVLDRYEETYLDGTFAEMMGTAAVEEMRGELDEAREALADAPATLDDIGTMSFDGGGRLTQVELDVLDIAAQVATAVEPDDADTARIADAIAGFEATGVFVTADIGGIGSTPTVLGEAATTVTWEQLRRIAEAAAAQFGDAFAAPAFDEQPLDGGAVEGLSDDQFGGFELGLSPRDVVPGDCFDDDDLYGAPGEGTTFACSQPHDNEAYAIVQIGLPSDPYSFEVVQRSYDDCGRALLGYVGGAGASPTGHLYGMVEPSRADWEAGVTFGVCYLFGFEPSTGSAAGTGGTGATDAGSTGATDAGSTGATGDGSNGDAGSTDG